MVVANQISPSVPDSNRTVPIKFPQINALIALRERYKKCTHARAQSTTTMPDLYRIVPNKHAGHRGRKQTLRLD